MKKIVAIFDLDGVLIKGQSLFFLVRYLRKLKKVSFFYFIGIFFWFLLYKIRLVKDVIGIRRKSLRIIKGWDVDSTKIILSKFYCESLKKKLSKEIVNLIQDHKSKGHLVIIASASLDVLVKIIASDIGSDFFVASSLEVSNGKYTGESGEIAYGLKKLEMLNNLFNLYAIEPVEIYVYSDDYSDIHLLSMAQHPIAINPTVYFRQVAQRNNWTIYDI